MGTKSLDEDYENGTNVPLGVSMVGGLGGG